MGIKGKKPKIGFGKSTLLYTMVQKNQKFLHTVREVSLLD
jgi:hypothetical protein